eukprot:COSAG05_NODE_1125_length_5794_cov_6.018450_7_plen_94_part_00
MADITAVLEAQMVAQAGRNTIGTETERETVAGNARPFSPPPACARGRGRGRGAAAAPRPSLAPCAASPAPDSNSYEDLGQYHIDLEPCRCALL